MLPITPYPKGYLRPASAGGEPRRNLTVLLSRTQIAVVPLAVTAQRATGAAGRGSRPCRGSPWTRTAVG
ncbi:hypothetical protein [Ornithinimicrobium kibberense]|uniref:hypothetical protein n=1 Tax=Ornithinimicrobium kibberense TaxID=282060 RepID=UPI0036208EF4